MVEFFAGMLPVPEVEGDFMAIGAGGSSSNGVSRKCPSGRSGHSPITES
jgi:hypothetical protein